MRRNVPDSFISDQRVGKDACFDQIWCSIGIELSSVGFFLGEIDDCIQAYSSHTRVDCRGIYVGLEYAYQQSRSIGGKTCPSFWVCKGQGLNISQTTKCLLPIAKNYPADLASYQP